MQNEESAVFGDKGETPQREELTVSLKLLKDPF